MTVVPLRPALDVPAMLRLLADRVDAGEFDVASAACVVELTDRTVELFGWGNTDGLHTVGLLHAGMRRVTP